MVSAVEYCGQRYPQWAAGSVGNLEIGNKLHGMPVYSGKIRQFRHVMSETRTLPTIVDNDVHICRRLRTAQRIRRLAADSASRTPSQAEWHVAGAHFAHRGKDRGT